MATGREPGDASGRLSTMKASRLVTMLAVVVAACGTPAVDGSSTAPLAPATTTAPPATEVPPEVTPRMQWEAAALDDYHYTFLDDCGECNQLPPRQVAVWGTDVVDSERAAPSVEEVFEMIERAEAAGSEVEVTYHPELGYPTDVWIDRPDRAFDGGTHWVLSDLAAGLPGDRASAEGVQAASMRWDATGPDSYEYRWSLICDCPLDGTLRTRVEDGIVTDWDVELAGPGTPNVTPITIDTMLTDLAELFGSPDGLDVEGVRFTGSASYHPELGYPEWVGLDVEVLDPTAELATLAPRIVFMVTEFTDIESVPDSDLATARALWAAKGPASYSYSLTVHNVETGSLSEPYVVTVSDRTVTSVTLDGVPAEHPELPAHPIETLFDLIGQWTEAGSEIDVIYHEGFGHPVVVLVDLGDGLLLFSIADLEPA